MGAAFALPGCLTLCFHPTRPRQGSRDNMTCIVVCFPAAPEVSREALQKETELDAYLEKRVEGVYQSDSWVAGSMEATRVGENRSWSLEG